jgi:hypothetical protein
MTTLAITGNSARVGTVTFCTNVTHTAALTSVSGAGSVNTFDFWVGNPIPITFSEDMLAAAPPQTVVKNGPLTNYEIDANFRLLESRMKPAVPPVITGGVVDYGLLIIKEKPFGIANPSDIYGDTANPVAPMFPTYNGPYQFVNLEGYSLKRDQATHHMFIYPQGGGDTGVSNEGIIIRPESEMDFPIGSWFLVNSGGSVGISIIGKTPDVKVKAAPVYEDAHSNGGSPCVSNYDYSYNISWVQPPTYIGYPGCITMLCIKTGPDFWEVSDLTRYMNIF